MTGSSISVCHVVNAVDTTSVPADIATALAAHTDVRAGICAWFDADAFDGDDTVDVHCVDAPRTTLGVDRSALRDLASILSQYDVVQTHHNHSGTYAKPVAVLQDAALVSTEQNTHGGFTTKGLIANAVTNPLAEVVTCVSPAVQDSFRWWERQLLRGTDVRVIYNGVDLERIVRSTDTDWTVFDADVDPDASLVGTAGMFTEQKAHDVLLDAVARTRERGLDVELVMAGDGDLRPELERLASREGIEESVHFLGLLDRTEVYRLMSEVDVYAMPSRWEGFSAAAVEALALGTPCLFSNIDEFTKPFANVAAFHNVDDPADLSAVLADLLVDDQWREKLGEKGRDRAKDFSMETIAAQYEALYAELVG